ncbi:uncharacterized protein LOC135145322 isoform X2 [Zophobas morio]|uniref:uncharacterized protein LOC135145322 isoform X2 n=1 Tax=Zophobas morio TaxID=2755281 RepID=UPI0030833A3A
MEESFVPPPINFKFQVLDVTFAPYAKYIASGLINGGVYVHSYEKDAHELKCHWKAFKKSCRALHFSQDGSALFAASRDRSLALLDLSTGNVISKKKRAHLHPINALQVLNEHLLVTGDDNGIIKSWDTRTDRSIMELCHCADYISAFSFHYPTKTLLATSGDGTLSAVNMRKRILIERSIGLDEELSSVAIIKNGTKVVCGTQNGSLDIFSWGEWRDISDRLVGHPEAVDCLLAVDEETLATGSSDGFIRIITVQPHKFLCVLGKHEDLPVEKLCLSEDRELLASCSHDCTVLGRKEVSLYSQTT